MTSGNIHDSVAFDKLYEKVTERFPQIETLTMDAGYKTPWICKRIFDDRRVPSLPYKRPMRRKDFMNGLNMYMTNIWTLLSVRNIKA